ncbi:hypothetical protein EGW08_004184, partial [Elysia chlorotica]
MVATACGAAGIAEEHIVGGGGGRRGGRKSGRAQRRRQQKRNKRHLNRGLRLRSLRQRRSAGEHGDHSLSLPVEFSGLESLFDRRCRILANETILCDLDIYQKPSEWALHKEKIDAMIREYRKALDDLRDIRRHLREQRPAEDDTDDESDGDVTETDTWTPGTDGTSGDASGGVGGACLCDEAGRVVAR